MKLIKPTKEGDNTTRIILDTEEEKQNFLRNWQKLIERRDELLQKVRLSQSNYQQRVIK